MLLLDNLPIHEKFKMSKVGASYDTERCKAHAFRDGMGALWLCLATTVVAASSSTQSTGKTKGLVVTKFLVPIHEGDDVCPEGLNVGPDQEAVLAKFSKAERESLKRPENADRYRAIERHRGPAGSDVCAFPRRSPDPGFKTVQGQYSFGMDLDGSDGTTTPFNMCPHKNFVGLDGEPGVDNQWYRAVGCINGLRKDHFMYDYFDAGMRQGDFTILIEIGAVDDLKNDDEVEVGVYAGEDPMVTNSSSGVVLTNASLRVHHDPYFHAMTRGKIVDGVLTTQPANIRFKAPAERSQHFFRDARLRLRLASDGTAKGMLAGYQNINNAYHDIADFFHSEGPLHGPMTCPGFYNALKRLADGYPDPLGGPCEWISTAFEVEAIPAFIIHPDYSGLREKSNATTPPSERRSWWQKLFGD